MFVNCSFLVEFLDSLMYIIISSENSDTLTSSFPTCVPLFVSNSFSHLIAWARTSSTVLKRYGESGQTCFVSDFSGHALTFSPFNLILGIDLWYCLYFISACPLYPFSKTYHKGLLDFVKYSFGIWWDIYVGFFFQFFLYGALLWWLFPVVNLATSGVNCNAEIEKTLVICV